MMNDTHINEILKDLAALDPVFGDERKVRPLVEALLALSPKTRMDDAFKSRLKRELLARASVMPERAPWFGAFMAWGKLAYAGAGALAAILILVGVVYGPGWFSSSGGVRIVSVGERAFGDLTMQGGGGMGASTMRGGAEAAPAPQSDDIARSVPTAVLGMGGGTGAGGGIAGMPSPLIYPAPEMPRIDFVYRGELPAIGETVEVLRRVKPETAPGGALTALRRFAMGLLDLGEFSGANVESFSLAEEEPYGYSVYVNPLEGSVSISQNWRQWPQMGGVDGPAVMQTQEGGVPVPPDAELIAIADAFLDEYDIDRGGYGDPVVQKNWGGIPMPLMEEKALLPAYLYDIQIIYPYVVNDGPIYDEGGNPTGLSVNVNVKEKRVSGVWGLMTRRYESSAYAAERDVERLLAYAENRYWYGDGARTVVVEVDAPERVHLNMWIWGGTEGSEVVVPALAFPVPQNLNIPNVYLPQTLVVPLAKDLIQNQGGPVRILEQ